MRLEATREQNNDDLYWLVLINASLKPTPMGRDENESIGSF